MGNKVSNAFGVVEEIDENVGRDVEARGFLESRAEVMEKVRNRGEGQKVRAREKVLVRSEVDSLDSREEEKVGQAECGVG